MSKKRASTHRSMVRFDARMLPGAKPALFPGFIKPQLATLKEAVPVGNDWLHGIKFDGYRVQGHLIGVKSALITRGGNDWTRKMRTIDAALSEIPVQAAVDTRHHLIVAHEVTTSASDRAQLAPMSKLAKEVLGAAELDVVADCGYFTSEQILECAEAGISVTAPKPQTSNNRARGQFGKPDFCYIASDDMYICPAGEALLLVSYKRETDGPSLRRYATRACTSCKLRER